MILQNTTYRIFSYLFTLVLFVGLACSSDDNTVVDDDDPFQDDASLTMKIDGELWSSDVAIVQTFREVDPSEDYLLVTIRAIKFLDEIESKYETFGINIFIDNSDFNNPKAIYLAPPPFEENAGYSFALWESTEDVINYFSVNSDDQERKVGKIQITDFEIGEQETDSVYVSLTGTFEFEMWGTNFETGEQTGKLNITEGRFYITETSLF